MNIGKKNASVHQMPPWYGYESDITDPCKQDGPSQPLLYPDGLVIMTSVWGVGLRT